MDPLTSEVFKERRNELMRRIGPNGVVLVHSPPDPGTWPFRPNADFTYLTGILEPNATLVLRPGHEKPVVLFVRERDPERERWDGLLTGTERARSEFGADLAYPSTELAEKLPDLLAGRETLHYHFGHHHEFDKLVTECASSLRKKERSGKQPFSKIVDTRQSLHEMRLRKSDHEISILKKAVAITKKAHLRAMSIASAGIGEFELEAAIAEEFRSAGGNGPGYQSIVGGGNRANILHYVNNDRKLEPGTLVLIDAGCDYQGYTADVTRTFPVDGVFTQAQKDCYQGVLEVQKSAIEQIRPGITLLDIHNFCVKGLTELMVKLGLLEGDVDALIKDLSYKKFYMHRTSHWLGMDVHDVGSYTKDEQPRPVEAGMVITVEPRLYIDNSIDAPGEFRGIGIRIEDDILVTATGCEVLSSEIPKEVEELEKACASSLGGPSAP